MLQKIDDVLVKEDEDGKHYITDVLGKTFVFKDSGIEIRDLRDAIKFQEHGWTRQVGSQ